VARKEISPGSRTLYALNMPDPRVRATMFTRQGRRTDPHGHSHSVELHEAASPYRHPRYDRPSAKEKLSPLVPSAASGREPPDGPPDSNGMDPSSHLTASSARLEVCCHQSRNEEESS